MDVVEHKRPGLIDLEKYQKAIQEDLDLEAKGRISQVVGLTIKPLGPAPSGELCYIRPGSAGDFELLAGGWI